MVDKPNRDDDNLQEDHGDSESKKSGISRRDLIRAGWGIPLIVAASSPRLLADKDLGWDNDTDIDDGDVQPKHADEMTPHVDLMPHSDRQRHNDQNPHGDGHPHDDYHAHIDRDNPHLDMYPHYDGFPHDDVNPHLDTAPHIDTPLHTDLQLHVDVEPEDRQKDGR